MPKIITQHRRGTTSEWAQSNVIIADGEVVIEELNDGTTKLKVGDGHSKFSELPYVTKKIEETLAAQTSRIDDIIAINGDEISSDDPLYEIVDIRTGYDGIKHTTAGNAVRAIGEDVSDLRTSLQQFINADAVDGLLYENNLLYLTADGVIVSDPVEITGGSGGGGTSSSVVIKLKSLNETNTFSVTATDKVLLKFNFISEEDSESTGDGTCTIQVGGVQKKKYSIKQGDNEVDVTDYLDAGENSIRLTCTDIYGNTRSLVYTVNVIELVIKSTFDPYIPYSNDIDYRYTVTGLVEKTVHFTVDGKVVGESTLSASSSGKSTNQIFPIADLTHGVHRFDVYATANLDGSLVESNHLIYDVIVALPQETAPMIASIYEETEIGEGELISIPYIVYDPNDAVCKITLEVSYKKAGETVVYSSTELEVDSSLQTWATRQFPEEGTVTFAIIYEGLRKEHVVSVVKSDIDVEAETGAKLYLSSKGRDNSEASPDNWVYENVVTKFTGFNWSSNGWVKDGPDGKSGDTCLRLNGGATAEVEFYPFDKLDSKLTVSGLTLEFEFAIRDISNRDTVVISCCTDTEVEGTTKTVGIKATADKAVLGTSKNTISCNYKDLEKIRVSFTIDSNTEGSSKFMSCYLDGVLSGVVAYTDEDSFNSASKIKLGDTGCTLDLYTIRVYDRALTAKEILNNYIADTTDMGTKLEVYTDNDIYDSYGRLSYEELKKRIPTITFTGQMPAYKGDKRVVKMDFENPFDESKSFKSVYGGPIDVEIDVQGTSSQFYVRKNWKIKLKKKDKNTGATIFNHKPYQHMDNEIAAQVFCIKVDYAEGTGTHNTQNNNVVETLYQEKILPQYHDEQVRTTVCGFPVVIFEKETEDSTPVFSSKGNFNFDKDAENAFGFTEDYDTECWEFCNNTHDTCNFLDNIDTSNSWLDNFEPRYTAADFDRLEELEELYADANATPPTAVITEEELAELAELRNSMIARFKKMHDWVVSTKGDVQKFKSEFTKYFNLHYALIYYVYTFFALMVDQRAKNMFLTYWPERVTKSDEGNWVIGGIDTGIYAANTGNPYVKDDVWYIDDTNTEIIAGHWYPYFYDNDTSYGIDNVGNLAFDYYHEDIDTIGTGADVYNGQNSTLWVNFRQAFASEIKEMYAKLRSDKLLTYDKVINQFITEGSEMYSASIYNEDAEYKYLSMARPENLTGDQKIDTTNLYQVRGDGEHHLKYFVDNRIKYCDSKWYAGDYPDNLVSLRIYTPKLVEYPEGATEEQKAEIDAQNEIISRTLEVVPPNPEITVTPFSDMYCGVRYGAGSALLSKRAKKNTPVTFGSGGTYNDTETAIYGASELSSLGDLSALYCKTLNVSKAAKLSRLQIGNSTEGYRNDNLSELSLSTSPLLKVLDITNCSGLTQALNLEGCANIEELYALGTKITGVSLAPSGYLTKLYLPATIDSLTLKNQHNLYTSNICIGEKDSLVTRNITKLVLVNCPNVDGTHILQSCLTAQNSRLRSVYITGVNWNVDDWTQLQKLYTPSQAQLDDGSYFIGENGNYYEYSTDGNHIDTGLSSTLGFGYGLNGTDVNNQEVDYINIVGSCTINQDMVGEEMAQLVAHFPYLKFTMGEGYKLTSTVTFMDDSGENILHQETIETTYTEDITCPEPEIEVPTRESSIVYDYTFSGWSRNPAFDRLKQEDALKNVVGDRTLYPAFAGTLRSYPVEFYNGSTLLETAQDVIFYETAQYFGEEPLKYPEDAEASELHPFACWLPSPTVTEENLKEGVVKVYAQFKTIDEQWEVPTLAEITYTTDVETTTLQVTGRTTDWYDEPNVFIEFPESYSIENRGNYTVNSISGFYNFDSLQLLKFPDTIEKFRSQTIVENGEYVVKGAFANCPNLQKVTVGENVTDVGQLTFHKCSGLNEVEYRAIDASKGSSLAYETSPFRDTYSDNGFDLTIGKDVEIIPDYLFNQYSSRTNKRVINKLVWEEGSKCTKIGQNSFARTSIKELTLPTTLQEIAMNAFQNNRDITTLEIPETANPLTIRASAFKEWTALETLVIPSTVSTIESEVFGSASSLKTIVSNNENYPVLGNALVDINKGRLLRGVVGATIDERVTRIDGYAFDKLPLEEIEIPDTVTEIGIQAFSYTNLKNVVIPESVTKIEPQAFTRCYNLQSITLPSKLVEIPTYLCAYCYVLDNIVIPSSVEVIGDSAFRSNYALSSVEFNDKIKTINKDAFASCTALTSVVVPNTVTTLGNGAFKECSELSSVILSSNLTTLEANLFRNTAITEIVIPDSVTKITSYVNESTSELTAGTFYGCSKLKKVYLGKNTTDISQYTFVGCDGIEIHVPNSEEYYSEGWATGWGATNYTIVYNSVKE